MFVFFLLLQQVGDLDVSESIIVSVSNDCTMRVWDIRAPTCVAVVDVTSGETVPETAVSGRKRRGNGGPSAWPWTVRMHPVRECECE